MMGCAYTNHAYRCWLPHCAGQRTAGPDSPVSNHVVPGETTNAFAYPSSRLPTLMAASVRLGA